MRLLLLCAALTACSGTGNNVESSSPEASPPLSSATPVTEAAPPTILTYRLAEGGMVDAAGAAGRLVLHGGCVALEWSGGVSLLAFRTGSARWDAASGALRYREGLFTPGTRVRASGSPRGGIGVSPPAPDEVRRCGGGPVWIVANLEQD
jgi:hypothetical protein